MRLPDNYGNIKKYAALYKATLKNDVGRGIVAGTPDNDIFAVLMEKNEVQAMLDQEGCVYVAAILGTHFDENEVVTGVTISLLCVDGNKEVLDAHRTMGLPGQEVWPNKIPLKKLETFLP